MAVRDRTQLRRLRAERGLDAVADGGYQVRVSHELEEPDWDAFLATTPGGHHVQTSLWARVKAPLGWRVARIVVARGERIVAGAQLLLRSLPLIGSIGYVPKGPLFAVDDPVLTRLVIREMHRVARAYRTQYLVLQPPAVGEALAQQLPRCGFRPSSVEVAPTATVLLDLSQDLDDLLAQMKSKTRYNIRLGQRRGITVREVMERDLHTFYRFYVTTSRRQGFSPSPEGYFTEMWRVLHPHGYAKLFLAEYAGEGVSALFAIPFGDTVLYKRGGWSGDHGDRRPNEVLHWAAIRWAKAQGYRYYDLEGIDLKAVKAMEHDNPCPASMTETVTRFKLGFGGQVTLYPGAYDYVYNPLLRLAHSVVLPRLANWPVMAKMEDAARGIVGG